MLRLGVYDRRVKAYALAEMFRGPPLCDRGGRSRCQQAKEAGAERQPREQRRQRADDEPASTQRRETWPEELPERAHLLGVQVSSEHRCRARPVGIVWTAGPQLERVTSSFEEGHVTKRTESLLNCA